MSLIQDLKKIFGILEKEDKFDFFLLTVLLVLTSLLEIVGIASIIPFLHSIINEDNLLDNNILRFFFNYFEFENTKNFQIFIFSSFFGLVIFSIIFRSLTVYFQYKFALLKEYSISSRLLKNYVNQEYLWFTNHNTSKLIKNLLSEVSTVVNVGIVHFINIISQFFIIIGIISLLLIINFKVSFISGFFLIFTYFITFKFFASILKSFGDKRYNANENRFLIVDEIFNTIREIKFFNLTRQYESIFNEQNLDYVKKNLFASVISVLPRYFFELLILSILLVFIFIIIKNNYDLFKIIPIISFYLFACYRLMPALQSSYNSISKLKFTNKSLESLSSEFLKTNLTNPNNYSYQDKGNIDFKNSISFHNIYFKYPGSRKENLEDLSAKFKKGSKIGISGKTGSGKTTFINLLTGMFLPRLGKILIDDIELTTNNFHLFRKKIGYVPQNTILIDDTLAANIALIDKYKNIDYEKLIEASKKAEIYKFIHGDLPEKFKTKIGENGVKLSGGQRQRIGIARALYHNPEILIFDESTNALDNLTEKNVFKNVMKIKNVTLFVISHNLEILKDFDELFYFRDGKLIKEN